MFVRVNQQVALQVSDWPQIQGQSHQTLLNQLALLRNTIREGKAGRHSSHWQSLTAPFYCKANAEEDYRWETCSPTHSWTSFLHVIYLCNGIAQLFQLYVQLHPLKQIIQVWCNLTELSSTNYALQFCIVAGILRALQWQPLCRRLHALLSTSDLKIATSYSAGDHLGFGARIWRLCPTWNGVAMYLELNLFQSLPVDLSHLVQLFNIHRNGS